MGKKLAVILPLYLASIVLLGFSVFPHHHHRSYICFNSVHHFSTTDPHHHPHPEIPEKGCHIQYLFQADNIKTFSRQHLLQDKLFQDFTFLCVIADPLIVQAPTDAVEILLDNGDKTFLQHLSSSHKLTRGPPQIG